MDYSHKKKQEQRTEFFTSNIKTVYLEKEIVVISEGKTTS